MVPGPAGQKKPWMLFVDGENFARRAAEVAGSLLMPGPLGVPLVCLNGSVRPQAPFQASTKVRVSLGNGALVGGPPIAHDLSPSDDQIVDQGIGNQIGVKREQSKSTFFRAAIPFTVSGAVVTRAA